MPTFLKTFPFFHIFVPIWVKVAKSFKKIVVRFFNLCHCQSHVVIVDLVNVVGGDNSDQLHLLHSSTSKEVIFHMVVVDNCEWNLKRFLCCHVLDLNLAFANRGESDDLLYILRTCAAGMILFSYLVPFNSFFLMTLQVAPVSIWNLLVYPPFIFIVVNRRG